MPEKHANQLCCEFKPRNAVRAVIADPAARRVLLIQMRVPDSNTSIWITPGGGLESGEDEMTALKREVREETGLVIDTAEGPIWYRRMQFHLYGKGFDQSETYYYIEVPQFTADHEHNPAADERSTFESFRWWRIKEINNAHDHIFVPKTLGLHVERLLDQGIPEQPYDVGR